MITSHVKPGRNEDLVRKGNFGTVMEIMNFQTCLKKFHFSLRMKEQLRESFRGFQNSQ